MKSRESSKCDVLAAAALTLGVLKHGNTAEIYHMHMPFVRFHASIPK